MTWFWFGSRCEAGPGGCYFPAMADPTEEETPRLSPMTSPEGRAEYVRHLKARIDAGEYFVTPEDIARAVLAQITEKYRF